MTLETAEVREEISELSAVERDVSPAALSTSSEERAEERDTSPAALSTTSEDNAVERDASAF